MALRGGKPVSPVVAVLVFTWLGSVLAGLFFWQQNVELKKVLNGTTQMRFGCESALTNCYEELHNAGK